MEKSDISRNISWDIVRCIGIVFVILGHCLPYTHACSFIYQFHMGLFFFISGFFLKIPEDFKLYDFSNFFTHKLKSIYLPFVVVNLLFLIFNSYFYKAHISLIKYEYFDYIKAVIDILFFRTIENPILYPLWFLKSLFVSLLLSYFILSVIKKNILALICFVVLYSIGFLFDFYGITIKVISNRDLIACFLVFIGYMFKLHKEWIDFIHKHWSIIIFVSFILLYFGSIFFVIDMKHNCFSYYGVVPIMTIIGVVFCISLSDFILYINFKLQPLLFIGRYSLYYFIIHTMAFKFISLFIVWYHNLSISENPCYLTDHVVRNELLYFYWPLYVISGILIPSIYVIFKNEIFKKHINHWFYAFLC